MINVFTLLGFALGLVAVVLLLRGAVGIVVGLVKRWRMRKKPLHVDGEGIYSGAMTAREVYVPGTIGRRLGLVVLALGVAAAGAAVGWVGLALAAYPRVDQPARLARVQLAKGVARVEPAGGRPVEGQLPGAVLVAHADYIAFAAPLARVGLGTHARLTRLGSYRSMGDALNRGGIALLDLGGDGALYRLASWVSERKPDWVRTSHRFSPILPPGRGDAELWASPDGLEWR